MVSWLWLWLWLWLWRPLRLPGADEGWPRELLLDEFGSVVSCESKESRWKRRKQGETDGRADG